MKSVWKVLSVPLVFVVMILVLWPWITPYSGEYDVKSVIADVIEDVKDKIVGQKSDKRAGYAQNRALLKNIVIENVKIVPVPENRQMVTGTLRNSGNQTVDSLRLTITYYDETGETLDVATEWLNEIDHLKPGQTVKFGEVRYMKSGEETMAVRADVQVTSAEPVETGE